MHSPLVHIGYHKTATSWFQKNFYPLARNAVYVDRRLVRDAFLNTTAFLFDPGRATERLAVGDARPIVCEEGLCGFPDNSGFLEALSKDVAYRLHAVWPDAQIVIFIRNQLEMLRATYLQYVRGGGTHSLRRYLFAYERDPDFRRRWHLKPMFTLEHFAYQHLIRHYRSVFGPGNVHVFLYEEFAADPAAFAAAFADRFGLDIPFKEVSVARRNESLGATPLRLARLFGPFSRWDTPDRRVILPVIPKWMHKAGLKALNRTPLGRRRLTTGALFGERLYRELHNRYVPDNRELVRELDLPLAKHGYPMEPIGS